MTDNDLTMYESLVRELIMIREQKTSLASREKELRDSVVPYIEQFGEGTGSHGQHLRLALDPEIRGVKAVVWQEKVTQQVDEAKAEEIARIKGIYDDLFIMRPVLSEEAVMVALDEGLITQDDIEKIFPTRTTHALVFDKEKKK